jgi:hypothetical protein
MMTETYMGAGLDGEWAARLNNTIMEGPFLIFWYELKVSPKDSWVKTDPDRDTILRDVCGFVGEKACEVT